MSVAVDCNYITLGLPISVVTEILDRTLVFEL